MLIPNPDLIWNGSIVELVWTILALMSGTATAFNLRRARQLLAETKRRGYKNDPRYYINLEGVIINSVMTGITGISLLLGFWSISQPSASNTIGPTGLVLVLSLLLLQSGFAGLSLWLAHNRRRYEKMISAEIRDWTRERLLAILKRKNGNDENNDT